MLTSVEPDALTPSSKDLADQVLTSSVPPKLPAKDGDDDGSFGAIRPASPPILPISKTLNGNGKGKENDNYFESRPQQRIRPSSSASIVSLASTFRDSVSLHPLSRTQTATSHNTTTSQAADISSLDKLSKTRNVNGDSILMMAVQDRQPEVLRYLLEIPYLSVPFVLDDENNDGTTLLCAAVQIQNIDGVEILLNVLMDLPEEAILKYFQRTDNAGRTVGHYLFQ